MGGFFCRREKGLTPFPTSDETTPLLLPIGKQTRALTHAAVHSIVKRVIKGAADRIRARGVEMESKAQCIGGLDLTGFVKRYLSREHRDARGVGCTMAALGGDAARQPEAIKATFAAGIENLLTSLERDSTILGYGNHQQARAKAIDILAHAVGAVVLSRACPDDSPLADEILEACRVEILASRSPRP